MRKRTEVLVVLGAAAIAIALILWGGVATARWFEESAREEAVQAAREWFMEEYPPDGHWNAFGLVTETKFGVVETLRCGTAHDGWAGVKVTVGGDKVALLCCLGNTCEVAK